MQVFFILCSVFFAVYQYINRKYLYRTHVIQISLGNLTLAVIEACTGLTYFRCFANSESDDYEMEFVAVQYGQETQKSKCVILLFLGISGITH